MSEVTSEFQSKTKPPVRLIQVHPKPESTDAQDLEGFDFDIIALHGLDAETPETWIAWENPDDPESRKVNWLQDNDMLPSFVPNARILTYQWNARYDDAASSATFDGQATMLLQDIDTERYFTKRRERPIIFIASCFGGILLARALVTAATPVHTVRSGESSDVLKYTIGVIFLGTPFRGSATTGREAADIRYEAALASGRRCSPNMLQYLRQGSMHQPSELDDLVANFQGLINHHAFKFDITCVYETQTTNTSAYKKRLGDEYEEFARKKPPEFIVVDHNSARLGGTKELAIDARHNMLHKFNSPKNLGFLKIVRRLQEIINNSHEIINQRNFSYNFTRRDSQPKGQKQEHWQTKYLEALYFNGINYKPQQLREPGDTSCEWLVDDPSYSKWYNSGHSTFWILGHAGTGKSTLIKHAIKSCAKDVNPVESTVTLSFFFYNQGQPLQRTTEGLFRALLYQLLEKVPEEMDVMKETLDLRKYRLNQTREGKMSGTNLHESLWPTPGLMEIFETAVERIVERFNIRIFVDALDECKNTEKNEADVYDMVLKMQEMAEKLHFKPRKLSICFACRHIAKLARLDGDNHVFAERGNGRDIKDYVCQELDREIIDDDHLRDTVKNEILQSANGNFLWVTLIVSKVLTLHRGGRPDLLAEVRKLPRRIEELYTVAISSLDRETHPISLKFFQWVCFATRPLEVDEIRFAINIDPYKRYESFDDLPGPFWGDSDEHMKTLVCTLSGGLAEVRNSTEVFFVHQSVKDYMIDYGFCLLDPEQCNTQQVLKRSHDVLLTSCLWWSSESSISKVFDDFLASFSAEIIILAVSSLVREFDMAIDIYADLTPDSIRRGISALSDSDKQYLRDFERPDTLNDYDWNQSLPSKYTKSNESLNPKDWLFVDEVLACRIAWKTITSTTPSVSGYMYASFTWKEHALQSLSNGSENHATGALKAGLDLFFSRATPAQIFLHNHIFLTLHMSACMSCPAILREVLEQDASRYLDLNSKAFGLVSPLALASQAGLIDNVQIILGRHDIEVNNADIGGITALLVAIEAKHQSTVELLIDHGADLDHQDNAGTTALMYAAQSDQNEIMELLLRKGPRTEIQDNEGLTAVDHATEGCLEGLGRYIIMKVKRQEKESWRTKNPLSSL